MGLILAQIGFGDSARLSARMIQAGQEWGLSYAEVFERLGDPAWLRLFPAASHPSGPTLHPDRR